MTPTRVHESVVSTALSVRELLRKRSSVQEGSRGPRIAAPAESSRVHAVILYASRSKQTAWVTLGTSDGFVLLSAAAQAAVGIPLRRLERRSHLPPAHRILVSRVRRHTRCMLQVRLRWPVVKQWPVAGVPPFGRCSMCATTGHGVPWVWQLRPLSHSHLLPNVWIIGGKPVDSIPQCP